MTWTSDLFQISCHKKAPYLRLAGLGAARQELIGADGTVGIHEVSGGTAVAEYTPRMIGLALAEGKQMLSAVQHDLVQAQTADHCRPPATLPAVSGTMAG
jgi:hypothetical protein